jgi:hypothetical protein
MLDRQERTALALADERQEGVEQALVEDRVDGRVDGVAVPLEGVRQPPRPVEALHQQHAQPGVREKGRSGRAPRAAADHHHVVALIALEAQRLSGHHHRLPATATARPSPRTSR